MPTVGCPWLSIETSERPVLTCDPKVSPCRRKWLTHAHRLFWQLTHYMWLFCSPNKFIGIIILKILSSLQIISLWFLYSGANVTWHWRHNIPITGLTAIDTALTIVDCLKCSKCLLSTGYHRLDLCRRAACYRRRHFKLLRPTTQVRPALYFPPTTVCHSSQNKRATEVMSGDRRWCHRSIRRNYRICGPSVVKHRVSRDFCTVFDSFCSFFWGHVLPAFLRFFISLFIIFFWLVVLFLFGYSPAFEFYVPTFRNTLVVPSSQVTWPRPFKKEQNVPKRLHIKLRRRGITPKKQYNIHNATKIWNSRILLSSFIKTCLSLFIAASFLLLVSLSCFPFSLSRPDPHCGCQY